jgi:hypothetical protein
MTYHFRRICAAPRLRRSVGELRRFLSGNRPPGLSSHPASTSRQPAHRVTVGGLPLREGERESGASWSVSLRQSLRLFSQRRKLSLSHCILEPVQRQCSLAKHIKLKLERVYKPITHWNLSFFFLVFFLLFRLSSLCGRINFSRLSCILRVF